ncbi:TPA: adaptor protein MecA, partial [Pseudomonas aeruginosa]|nr:adaptor protein MecA [Pseudomonas aeruginosa]
HKLEELEKTLEEVDKAMTEPIKEVPEENIREDYTHYVLAFSDFDQVVTFTQGLKDIPVEGSELYKLGDVYYMTILLYLADEPDYYANNMYARFLEYANVADRTRAYLQEHATILMEEDALPVLQATKWS